MRSLLGLAWLVTLAVSTPLLILAYQQSAAPGAPPVEATEILIESKVRSYRASLYFNCNLATPRNTGEKVVYGKDDRKDIVKLDRSNAVEVVALKVAQSTCLLTDRKRVSQRADGSLDLLLAPYEFNNKAPCTGEAFRDQQVGGWCSGFLVGDDLVASAGHCFQAPVESDVPNVAFVFGFCVDAQGRTPSRFKAEQVYFGKTMVKHQQNVDGDYALIRLDRKVTSPGAVPLPVRREGAPALGAQIGMVGYPSGLPAKAAYGDQTKIYEVAGDSWLRTNLDSFAGNSGSVVTDQNGLVEGILVRGRRDYKLASSVNKPDCFYSDRLPDSWAGEMVVRASVFAPDLSGAKPAGTGGR